MTTLPKIIVIGGTRAQGEPIVKALSETGKYDIVVLTRNTSSPQAQALLELPHISLHKGTYTHEPDLWFLFQGAYGAFVNTDGFVIGEIAESFWGMRIFEIAARQGVKHYVWGNTFYHTKKAGYDPKYRVGHTDGKARVAEWFLAQKLPDVKVTIFTTVPYADMLWEGMFEPVKNADGSYSFPSAIGNGQIPLIGLCDLGPYITWILANPCRSSQLDLQVVTDIVPYSHIVHTFETVTGKKGNWLDLPYDEFASLRRLSDDVPAAWAGGGAVGGGVMSVKANFRGWWDSWRDSLYGWEDIDVALLDEINPGRCKNIEEWMRRVGYDGEKKGVLKDRADVAARVAAVAAAATRGE